MKVPAPFLCRRESPRHEKKLSGDPFLLGTGYYAAFAGWGPFRGPVPTVGRLFICLVGMLWLALGAGEGAELHPSPADAHQGDGHDNAAPASGGAESGRCWL
eukprot:1190832-Prorocentrum_minimum.AAC.2